jgi:hypothetical protein
MSEVAEGGAFAQHSEFDTTANSVGRFASQTIHSTSLPMPTSTVDFVITAV